MHYREPREEIDYQYSTPEEEEYREIDTHTPISQENTFIRYVTQLDPIPNIISAKYLRKYRRRVLFSGKIKGLSFISNPQTLVLNNCMRNNLSLAEDAGLEELADETVFDNIDMCQITRGQQGNLQNALITQRREFKDSSPMQEKQGIMSRIMKGKQDDEYVQFGAGGQD